MNIAVHRNILICVSFVLTSAAGRARPDRAAGAGRRRLRLSGRRQLGRGALSGAAMAIIAAIYADCVDGAAGPAADALSSCRRDLGPSTHLALLRRSLAILNAETADKRMPTPTPLP